MKKNLVVISMLLVSSAIMAQEKDLLIAETFLRGNEFEKGKEVIDNFLAKPTNANNPKAIYYKAFAYNAVSMGANKTLTEANKLNRESFEMLKKYRQLDPKETLLKEEENKTFYNIYNNFFDFALKAHKAEKYDTSYMSFKDALEIHDYIYTNKLHGPNAINFSALDTSLVWNLAILANNLKKNIEAADYYKKLVDNDLHDPKYLEAYQNLVINANKSKDQVMFEKYIAKGKAVFPADPFWEDMDIQNATEGLVSDSLFKKYEELAIKYPNNNNILLMYGNELMKYVYSDGNKNIDVSKYKARIPEVTKKALTINSSVEANMLLANYYYNNSFDLSDAAGKIKGTKPEDTKKRIALMADSRQSLDACLPYAEATVDQYGKMTKLRGMEKSNCRMAYDMLTEIYRVKGDPKKSAEYKLKKEAIQ